MKSFSPKILLQLQLIKFHVFVQVQEYIKMLTLQLVIGLVQPICEWSFFITLLINKHISLISLIFKEYTSVPIISSCRCVSDIFLGISFLNQP